MANHAHVLTQKPMTLSSVEHLFKTINQKYFFGLLVISYDEDGKSWYLQFEDVERGRTCWLKSETDFELRHGGGPDFILWADSLIQDAIAIEFDGQVVDDGVGQPKTKTWETPETFPDYIKGALTRYPNEKITLCDRIFVYRHYLRRQFEGVYEKIEKILKSLLTSDRNTLYNIRRDTKTCLT